MEDRSKGFNFTHCNSSGSHTLATGQGGISIDFHTPNAKYQYVDIGEINFTDLTAREMMELVDSTLPTSRGALTSASRSLSRKQAHWLQKLITDHLTMTLQGYVPSDKEIDELNKIDRKPANQVAYKEKVQVC